MHTVDISIDLIEPPAVVMRETIEGEAFDELVADIQENGLLQPLVVCQIPKAALDWPADDPRWNIPEGTPWPAHYRLIAGWRRLNACRRAGMLSVPCNVIETNELGEVRTMLRENLHRENPNAAEEGAMFAAMNETFHMTYEGIAQELKKSVGYVATRVALVRGPEEIRDAVRSGRISFSVGLELARCAHPADRERLLYHAQRGGCTAAVARMWVDEAEALRAIAPTWTDPAAPVVTEEAPPVILGACDFHEGQVPFNELVYPKMCAKCYTFVLACRDRAYAAQSGDGGPSDAAPHQH